mgnify:CR=1 FL=1
MLGHIDAFETEECSFDHSLVGVIGEHLKRVEYIVKNGHGVKEGCALEEHSHFAPKSMKFGFFHLRQVASVVLNAA